MVQDRKIKHTAWIAECFLHYRPGRARVGPGLPIAAPSPAPAPGFPVTGGAAMMSSLAWVIISE